MPKIAQRSIETIKQQVNLVDVVSPYVQLKRAGRSFKGLSPFTQEKTPSFYVHPDRGFFKCFSSGEGGDCFSFVMKMENLEFGEAVEWLGKKFNIQLEYESGGPSREEASLRKQLFEIQELATDWFHRQFLESDEAASVRTYWQEQRGFSMETAADLKIGYAPTAQDAFSQICAKRGISIPAMHRSGLFYAREQEREHLRFRSRFRGRLMIPIRDVQGRVVAFTARQLPQTPEDDPAHQAKYVNSPETPIFHKGRILFGMDHARTHLREGDGFLLVEGQLDAIRCWSVGLHTAVAPQGTALTEDQVHLLRRYDPPYVECLMDGDSAGRKAALKYIPLALKAGLEFRFLLLPEKADPDDLLRENGSPALEDLRKNQRMALDLALEASLPEGRPPSTHEKTSVLKSIYELVQQVPSQVAQEDYIRNAARKLSVDPEAALRDYSSLSHTNRNRTNPAKKDSNPPKTTGDALLTQATWELLWLLLHHPEHAQRIAQILDYHWIDTSEIAGSLLNRLTAELREGMIESTENIESIIQSDTERQLLADMHTRDLECESPTALIQKCLQTLYRNHLNERKKSLEQNIANADTPHSELRKLMQEVKSIRQQLAKPMDFSI
ncbi:MAG: DNA primase [Coraliomargaritaceae bacterium]